MHAANLLNKRRRGEKIKEELEKGKSSHGSTSGVNEGRDRDRDSIHGVGREGSKHISKKTYSQTSFLDSIAAGASTPTSGAVPSVSSRTTSGQHHTHHFYHGQHGNGYIDESRNTQFPAADPLIIYHKQEKIGCAHIGLCVMIVGTIVTVFAGFIGYLVGFGEPGVIIGCGGAIITVIGLVLLCCGNRCHLDERKLLNRGLPLIESLLSNNSADPERGDFRRSGKENCPDTLEVCKLTNPDKSSGTAGSGAQHQASNTISLNAKVTTNFTPVLEIDMVSEEPEPSGVTIESEADPGERAVSPGK